MLLKPSADAIHRLVRAALEEDAPWGDLTSQTLIPASAQVEAHLVAREAGVFCGEDLFRAAMSLTDPAITTAFASHDADHFAAGALLATVRGPARAILQAERVALNFVQRVSGIATLTAQYVAAAAGTHARIADTRKTTPGLRLIERYAVRCGGGVNHRFSLSDAVMIKDNHLAVLAANGVNDLSGRRDACRPSPYHVHRNRSRPPRPDRSSTGSRRGHDPVRQFHHHPATSGS
jgi:nicotinate-nucleotide pyrophosphorylase (carboxylating)